MKETTSKSKNQLCVNVSWWGETKFLMLARHELGLRLLVVNTFLPPSHLISVLTILFAMQMYN